MVNQTLLDVLLSIVMLMLALVLSEILRPSLRRVIPQRHQYLAMEAIFTFQLCLLVHELIVLTDAAGLSLLVLLPLSYVTIVLHLWSARCAQCNPNTALQQMLTGYCSPSKTILKIQFQMLSAYLARVIAALFHSLGLTRVHSSAAEECTSRLHTDTLVGTSVEFAGAFVFHTVLFYSTAAWYRLHVLGLLFIFFLWSVGEITGAFFNPALAFSINFFCKGSSLLDNIFVYWLGPIAGMILSVIIFDQLIPTLRRMARREEKID